MWTLYRTVVTERKAIYVQTLTLRFMSSGSGGIKWWIQAAEMSFLCRTQSQRPVEELEGEPLLLRVLKGVS